MPESTIVVRGEAVREVPPELAELSVTVDVRGADRAAVLARLAERAAAVRRLLDDAGAAVERYDTGAVRVAPQLTHAGRRVAGYAAAVTTRVTVTDFAVLGELLLGLAAQDEVELDGPWWGLRPGSRAGAEVRREAVADALARARDYAAALGARLDRLVELADEGTGGGGPSARAAFAESAMAGGLGDGPGLDVDPRPQTVRAAVVARFAATAPPLGDAAPPAGIAPPGDAAPPPAPGGGAAGGAQDGM